MSPEPGQRELWIVCGHIGAGKTTYCKQKVNSEGAFHCDKDEITFALGDGSQYHFWDLKARSEPEIAASEAQTLEELYFQPIRTAIRSSQLLVLVEGIHESIPEMDALIQLAESEGRRVYVKMLFTRAILESLESSKNRDFLLPEQAANAEKFFHARDGKALQEHFQRILRWHGDVVEMFNVYAERGMQIELYENKYNNCPPKIVANCQDGEITLEDEKAFEYFELKEKINKNAHLDISLGRRKDNSRFFSVSAPDLFDLNALSYGECHLASLLMGNYRDRRLSV